MYKTLLRLIAFIRDTLVPQRKTERQIAGITLEDLYFLSSMDGSLPYHDELVRALVWEIKYYANSHALALGGALVYEHLLAIAEEHVGTPLLIPIPMHPTRRRERGYNQTEVLAQAALKHDSTICEYAPQTLTRTIHTVQQQGLPKHKRLTNVSHSMRVEIPSLVRGRVCIVLDDVSTTGATFAEAARALTKAGARAVVCIALARS